MRTRRTIGVAIVSAALFASAPAAGHVEYVADGSTPAEALELLLSVLTEPIGAVALLGGALSVAVGIAGYLRFRPAAADVRAFRETMESYSDLLPWLLRLSIGLPLVGSGFAGYLFSPVVPAPTRLFGVTVGFLILFGLATRLAAGIGLLGYLVGLLSYPEILLAFEYVPGFLAIVLLGGGRPSADHVIAQMAADERTLYSRVDPLYRDLVVPFREAIEPYRQFVPTLLRVGVGATFVYLGFADKLLNPGKALATVEQYDLTAVVPVPPELWVVGAGLTEILVGAALVAGLFTRAFSGVAFLLFTTTLFALPDDPVLAHVTLFGLVSALLVTGSGPLGVDGSLSPTPAEGAAPATD